MSPTKTNASESSSGLSMRPRKVSTQKQRKAFKFKQRKIPKVLNKVASNISPCVYNLLTSHILAFMFLRSQDERFYERRRNVSHSGWHHDHDALRRTCQCLSMLRLAVNIASNHLSCLNHLHLRLKIQ